MKSKRSKSSKKDNYESYAVLKKDKHKRRESIGMGSTRHQQGESEEAATEDE